ncbi:hypothetical protein Q5P01_010740 [Channa striata]|uniref:Uncharacterized protein n=1 Tax=Channa striata TaxID=64152 RepID=A0AA88MSP7_CHASR|nr:hypothetical protein Q5P01_010740 [Channa striata]
MKVDHVVASPSSSPMYSLESLKDWRRVSPTAGAQRHTRCKCGERDSTPFRTKSTSLCCFDDSSFVQLSLSRWISSSSAQCNMDAPPPPLPPSFSSAESEGFCFFFFFLAQ